jgi:Ca2+-binding RTX toxin-like protein
MCEYRKLHSRATPGRDEQPQRRDGAQTARFTSEVAIRDAGAQVTPGDGCTKVDDNTVSCQHVTVVASTGDMDDTITLAGCGLADVDGGSGDDRLVGGDSSVRLVGGEGADTLVGSRADDALEGGTGNDELSRWSDGLPTRWGAR